MAVAIFLNPADLLPLKAAAQRGDLSVQDRRIGDRLAVLIGTPEALPLAPLTNRTTFLRPGIIMAQYPGGILTDPDTRIIVVNEVIQGQTVTKQMLLDWLRKLRDTYLDTPCGMLLKHLAGTAVEPWP
jgi:hypothetical protein